VRAFQVEAFKKGSKIRQSLQGLHSIIVIAGKIYVYRSMALSAALRTFSFRSCRPSDDKTFQRLLQFYSGLSCTLLIN